MPGVESGAKATAVCEMVAVFTQLTFLWENPGKQSACRHQDAGASVSEEPVGVRRREEGGRA